MVMPRVDMPAAMSTLRLCQTEKPPRVAVENASADALGRITRHTTDILTKNGAFCPCAVVVAAAVETPPLSTPLPVKKEAPAAAYLTIETPRPTQP